MTDLISRADAIEAVEQEYKIDRGYMADDYTYGFNQAIQYVSDIILHDLPSADAMQTEEKNRTLGSRFAKGGGDNIKTAKAIKEDGRPHGEWIWRTDIPIGDGRTSAGYICSNCGKDYWHGNVFDYCPSCGARMTGGDDE